jgi:hypothetical protein
MDAEAMLKTFVVALLALAMSVEVAHAKDLLPRSAERMKPPFHEMSERQKREVADELMMQPSAFGVLFIAASLLLVVFLCSPFADLLVGGHARYRSERSNLALTLDHREIP